MPAIVITAFSRPGNNRKLVPSKYEFVQVWERCRRARPTIAVCFVTKAERDTVQDLRSVRLKLSAGKALQFVSELGISQALMGM